MPLEVASLLCALLSGGGAGCLLRGTWYTQRREPGLAIRHALLGLLLLILATQAGCLALLHLRPVGSVGVAALALTICWVNSIALGVNVLWHSLLFARRWKERSL